MNKFTTVIITKPTFFDGEAEAICRYVEEGRYGLGEVRINADRGYVVVVRISLLEEVDALDEVADALLVVGRVERGEVDAAQAELQDIVGVILIVTLGNNASCFGFYKFIVELSLILFERV